MEHKRTSGRRALKRVKLPMHRYGEPDFDREYLKWGFHFWVYYVTTLDYHNWLWIVGKK